MAYDDVAVRLTEGFTVVSAGDTSRYYSRWIRSIVDPRFNNLVHIVREVLGQHSFDHVGIHYLLYDLEAEAVVRSTMVENTNTGPGIDNYRIPDIAYDPAEGRLWVVYLSVTASGNDSNPGPDGFSVLARSSTDDGASWSSRTTVGAGTGVGTGLNYSCPRISFGLNGAGHIIAIARATTPAQKDWVTWSYQGSSNWGSPTTLFGMTNTSGISQFGAIAVAHNGKAAALLPNNITSSTSTGVRLWYFNGTSWQYNGKLVDISTTSLPIYRNIELFYNLRNEQFQGIFEPSIGSGTDPNLHRVAVDVNGITLAVQDSGIDFYSQQFQSVGRWVTGAMSTLGDIYAVGGTSSSQGNLRKSMWDRGTNTWDAIAEDELEYNSQVADHSATIDTARPAQAGTLAIFLARARLFFTSTGFPVGGPDTAAEDIWTAEDPNIEAVTIEDLLINVGAIVGLHSYERIVGSPPEPRRRLMAYIGNAIYHDNGENEFAGNVLGTGAFEPAPDFAVFEDEVYIADGENTLKSWDGVEATADAITNDWDGNLAGDPPPVMVGLESAVNRLWGWTPDIPRRLLFSGLRDGHSWNLTQATEDEDDPGFIYLNDLPFGEPIVAVQEFFGDRICFSRNGIVRVTGDTPGLSLETASRVFQVSKINSQIGAESNLSVVDVGSDIIWLSRKGVHSLQATEKFGSVEEAYLSAPIQSFFAGLDTTQFTRAQAINYRKKNWYVVSVSRSGDGGKLKTLLVFDYSQRTWAIWTFDFEITALHSRVNPETAQEELLAGTNRGFVVILDQGTRQNELGPLHHTGTIRTMWLSMNDPRTYKKFTRLIIHLRHPDVGTLTGKYWVDNHAPTTFTVNQNPFDEAIIGDFFIGTDFIGAGANTPAQSTINLNARGRQLMVQFEGDEGNFSISGIEVETVPGASHRGDIS